MTSRQAHADFLVSYTEADEWWACWVAYELEEAGYSVVIQKWDFRPGADFVAEMDAAVTTCDRTIAILSPSYLSATFTKPEWRAAFAKDPDGAARKLIPIRIGDVKPEGLLRTRIWIDLIGVDEEAARERLLDGVRDGRAKPDESPPFPGGCHHTVEKPEHFPGVGRAEQQKDTGRVQLEDDDILVLNGLCDFQTALGDPKRGRHPLVGEDLHQIAGLDPDRINDAVEVLKVEGLVEVLEAVDTIPYQFRTVRLTAPGRRRASAMRKPVDPAPASLVAEEWVSHDFIERSGILGALNREGYRVTCPLQHEVSSRKLDGWEVAIVEYEGRRTRLKIHSGDPNDPHVMMKMLRRELTQEEAEEVARRHFGVGAHVRATGEGFEVRRFEPMPGLPLGTPPSLRTSVLGIGSTRNRALLAAGASLPEGT